MCLYGTADVAQMMTSNSLFDALVKGLLGDAEQLFHLWADLADTERVAGVAVIAVEQCPAVDGDDVAVLEHGLRIGDSVDHDLIHRGADAGRERPSIGIGETLESGNCSIVANELVGNLIQLEGRYARLDMFCQFAKGPSNKLVGLTHQLDLVFSLQKYLHTDLVGTHSATSVDTA